jgi:signal transduction histidine kinase
MRADQTDILRRIAKSARDLLELISTTLDVSRLEKEGAPLEVRAVTVADLIGEIELELWEIRQKPSVRFAWHIEASLPALRTDRTKLKLILKNLVSNAVKFTDAGCVQVSAQPRSGGVEMCVADTGVGIAAESLSVIFEAFRLGIDPLSRQREGGGLGLYIVRRTVELLGGSVSVESTPGKGSIFRVWVPNLDDESKEGPEEQPWEQFNEKIM